MGRIYTVSFSAVAFTPARDLFEIAPADDKPVVIRRIVVTPDSDETNKQLKVTLSRFSGAFTSGSGGSAPTPVPINSHDAAAGFTAETVNTTRATGGTSVLIQPESFPSQGGFEFNPDPDMRPVVYQGEAFVVGMEEDPAATYSGCLWAEEL